MYNTYHKPQRYTKWSLKDKNIPIKDILTSIAITIAIFISIFLIASIDCYI